MWRMRQVMYALSAAYVMRCMRQVMYALSDAYVMWCQRRGVHGMKDVQYRIDHNFKHNLICRYTVPYN